MSIAQQLVLPFILISAIAALLATMAWRRSRYPGSLGFAYLMVMVAGWLLTSGFSMLSTSPGEKLLWVKLTYGFTVWMGPVWLIFTSDFSKPGRPLPTIARAALLVVPIISLLLIITNESHGLFWRNIFLAADHPLTLVFVRGPWFWVFVSYTFVMKIAGLAVLGNKLFHLPRFQRQSMGILIGVVSVPMVLYLLSLPNWIPFYKPEYTPFAFALCGFLYAWGFFHERIFDPIPLASGMILENIGVGYLVIDQHNIVMEINSLAQKLLHINQKDMVGWNVADALENWPQLIAFLHGENGDRIELDLSPLPADQYKPGEWIRLEARLSPWFRPGKRSSGRLLILSDITAHKQVEERLQESDRMHRLLVESAPTGILTTDERYTVSYASPTTEELFRIQPGTNLIGFRVVDWIHPEDRAAALSRMQRVRNGQKILPFEYRMIRMDGTVFWGEVSSSPIMTEEGRPRGVLSMVRDVTPRKALERRLERNLEEQTFMNDLLQMLYRQSELHKSLDLVLTRAGLFTQADRISVCEDSMDGEETTVALEWCGSGVRPRAHSGPLFRYREIPIWRQWMDQHGMVLVSRKSKGNQRTALNENNFEEVFRALPEEARAIHVQLREAAVLSEEMAVAEPFAETEDISVFMDAWNIGSLLALPLLGMERKKYGFLLIEDSVLDRQWKCEELDLLRNLCRMVSDAVARKQVEEAEHHQRAMAEAMRDTVSTLNSTLNVDEVLDRILNHLDDVIPHDSANIVLYDERHEQFRVVRHRGYEGHVEEYVRSFSMRYEAGIAYFGIKMNQNVSVISDTHSDPRWKPEPLFDWVGSYAGAQIKARDQVLGIINLESTEPGFFTAEHGERLQFFADQAAVAMENARLYVEAHRRAEDMAILYRIGLTLTAGLEMNQVLVTLLEQCHEVLPIDAFYVAVYDPESEMVEMPLLFQEGDIRPSEPFSLRDEPGLTGAVIRLRRTIYLPDLYDPAVEKEYQVVNLGGQPVRSYVGVPLILVDQVVGVISMQSYDVHAYTPDQVRLLETIGTQAGVALQNARMYHQMRQMAITDAVTGLNTRRHFTALGRSELERALRYRRALSVLMVDIDHFKHVNDTFGHNVGDLVLQAVASVCQQAIRQTDIVGRWGGEEFAILLPEANQEGAGLIAERIRRMVDANEVEVGDGSVRVTVSIGVATLCPSATRLELLVDCADRALYAAKQSGRNQVRYCSTLCPALIP